MIRDLLARAALRAYPPQVRTTQGGEMLGTLLDASAGSPARLVRELGSLTRSGLRARATQVASGGAARVIADGICLGAVWLLTLDLVILIRQRLDGSDDRLLASWSIGLLGASVALALLGRDRLAGVAAVIWTVSRFPALRHDVFHPMALGTVPPAYSSSYTPTASQTVHVLYLSVVPLICFAVLIAAPRRRALDVRRLAWLAVPAALIAIDAVFLERGGGGIVGLALLFAALLVGALAIVMLPVDPRLALACSMPFTLGGLGDVWWPMQKPALGVIAFLLATPLVLAFALACNRQLRRNTAGP